jgi:hypothetical protein
MVMLAGQNKVGPVLSSATMICTQVLEFPQSSVARHVRVIVNSSGHPLGITTSVKVMAGDPSQLSDPVATPRLALVKGFVSTPHSIVTLGGHVTDGAELSSTKIVWLHVDELPQLSVARQVRVIVYSCGHVPATVRSMKVTAGAPAQSSVAVAVPNAGLTVGSVLAVHWIVTFAGQAMAGGVLSSMNINCTQLVEFPQSSVAVQVRVMADSLLQPPGEEASEKLIVSVASQLSVAVAEPSAGLTAGFVLAEHSMVTLAGQLITGARLSSTTMTWVHVLLLPQSSVANQVRVMVRS